MGHTFVLQLNILAQRLINSPHTGLPGKDTRLFLSRWADIVKTLCAELDQAMPDRRSISNISVLKKLPYLGAFSKEGE